ncbi:similar to Saccharomyces cerevisiae YGR076C MRPL25 Mitochondrial ribosomal protein of the large subunit [Maudiozyma saulgeensis]|uniref:Similar to Saccharomyces cerevisiae YGR076C MRPL25 Mitochondrial ribosomal protein of the large subunit n=1 Tax=Maudiozyma saulgeensis TaxID=1789683 RepID=A0A1X7R471_9SACH|nr:similar to Saccharomyces cerevisiae YGR076C MRPL25 Mitochondrial ribosomal protein of the large subunit [Kazachstania saulgeensis]
MSALKQFEALPRQLKQFFYKYPPHVKYASNSVSTHALEANPFIANRHPVTQTYHDPVYSKRRMSEIFKLAHRYGVTEFLPPITDKLFFEEKYEKKTFMKGVLLPKGHKHELNKASRQKAISDALLEADNTIAKVRGKKFTRRLEKKQKNTVSWF